MYHYFSWGHSLGHGETSDFGVVLMGPDGMQSVPYFRGDPYTQLDFGIVTSDQPPRSLLNRYLPMSSTALRRTLRDIIVKATSS